MKIKQIQTLLKAFYQTLKNGEWLKSPIFWAQFMAYAIPLSFLVYVLYMNYLPFGYNKTFTIDVGSETDTKVGEFYLEPSKDLSERKIGIDENGNEYTYRELNGIAYAVFKPNAVLKNAEITVSVEGEGVSIIPPVIDFDPDSVEWDYSWDFTQGKTPEELGLKGNAFPFDGAMYFDGKSRLELPDSTDKFEDGAFSVYAEWTPTNSEDNFQQIVGHFNWELLQNKDSVSFQVGRMNDATGRIYSVGYPVTPEFFNQKHTALAIYSPATETSTNGYIDLFVDNNFAGRTYIAQDVVWVGYGIQNLSLGKSKHGASTNLRGALYSMSIIINKISLLQKESNFNISSSESINLLLITTATSSLNFINLNVNQ